MMLLTRWRGWQDKKSLTMEPLENMVQDWPNMLRDYCAESAQVREICIKYYASPLFE
jgi:hypothetical protein